jgi:phenylacetate-coenzyme A ligase PaaK-like adenylate-forming protein
MTEMLRELGSQTPVILGTYGFTEARTAWIECPDENAHGYHLYPDFEIFEVIDPETWEPVGEGEDGEIVYTSLDWRGSCVLRYRTGDYAKGGIVHEKCPGCGRIGPRLTHDITRLSNLSEFRLTDIRGTVVNLNELVPIMMSIPEVIEWQIEITKRNEDPFELDELNLYIAVRSGTDQESLVKSIGERFAYATEVKPSNVHFLPVDEVVRRLEMETSQKEQRIVDHRPRIYNKGGMD